MKYPIDTRFGILAVVKSPEWPKGKMQELDGNEGKGRQGKGVVKSNFWLAGLVAEPAGKALFCAEDKGNLQMDMQSFVLSEQGCLSEHFNPRLLTRFIGRTLTAARESTHESVESKL